MTVTARRVGKGPCLAAQEARRREQEHGRVQAVVGADTGKFPVEQVRRQAVGEKQRRNKTFAASFLLIWPWSRMDLLCAA